MINKKYISIINILFTIFFLSVPYFVFAQNSDMANPNNPIVTCDSVETCDWNRFLQTVDNVKDFIFQLVVILSVGFIVYAGVLMLFSGENASKREQAKNIMSNVVIGFFLASAGWLIVNAILKTLGVGSEFAPSDLLR